MMIKPADIGITNPKFSKFRRHQFETAVQVAKSEKRFAVINAPPGAGKSLIYFALMEILEARSIVLTVTKALQTQITNDLNHGWVERCVDIRGLNNYECLDDGGRCDEGKCQIGETCERKLSDCLFYSKVRAACKSNTVITNPHFWFYGADLGKFDLMVIDEGHKLLEIMTDLLMLTVSQHEIEKFVGKVFDFPQSSDSVSCWTFWLNKQIDKMASLELSEWPTKKIVGMRNLMKSVKSTVNLIESDLDNWIVTKADETRKHSRRGEPVILKPVWPGQYLDQTITKGIEKVAIFSATISEDDLGLLGIRQEEVDFIELPSLFPEERRPFFYISASPKIRIDYKTTQQVFGRFVNKHFDSVIGRRLDRKGLIQSRSYVWSRRIVEESRYSKLMISHGPGEIEKAFHYYRNSASPVILVSPGIESGYDFPYDQARYQIILKNPRPDMRDQLSKVRARKFSGYADLLTVRSLMQMYGRTTRYDDDFSETFVFDLYFFWFYKKTWRLFPKYFRDAFRHVDRIPRPAKLKTRGVGS